MRIAWFTPFCQASAIGQYSALILDRLSQDHEVTVYATGLERGPSWRPGMRTRIVSAPVLSAELAAFDSVVYNQGNNHAFHDAIYMTHLIHPGVVILHDLSAWNFFSEWCLFDRPRPDRWLACMEYAHGTEGSSWGRRYLAESVSLEGSQEGASRWTMSRAAVHGALGVVVHGRQVRDLLASQTAMPVQHIDFPSPRLPEPKEARPDSQGRTRLLSFGMMHRNKAPDMVVQALAESPVLRSRCLYTMAGRFCSADYAREVREQVEDYGLGESVRFVDRPDDATLHRLIDEADVLVNLRYPHNGESSWSLLEALWQGKATVVWRHGYYDEFPEGAVAKVACQAELAAALETLVSRPEDRQRMAARARAHARGRFSTEGYCRRMVSFLEDCRSARPAASLADRAGRALRALGLEGAGLAERLGREIAQMAPAPAVRPLREAA